MKTLYSSIELTIHDSGFLSGVENMRLDTEALHAIQSDQSTTPKLRLFQWTEPVVSFGYLLNEDLVRAWAEKEGVSHVVRRPTGGGTVHHGTQELALSLLWRRPHPQLPDRPRDCYAKIHAALKKGLDNFFQSSVPLPDRGKGRGGGNRVTSNHLNFEKASLMTPSPNPSPVPSPIGEGDTFFG